MNKRYPWEHVPTGTTGTNYFFLVAGFFVVVVVFFGAAFALAIKTSMVFFVV